MSFFARQRKIIFALGIALVALSLILILEKTKKIPEELSLWRDGQKIFVLEVADSHTEREWGLSGREKLSDNQAMLFIFEEPGEHGIWMKDMNFPIDIIWLNQEFEVVNFKENVSPQTFPTTFKPSEPSLYVLETNSGFIEQFDIKVGETLDFRKEIPKS